MSSSDDFFKDMGAGSPPPAARPRTTLARPPPPKGAAAGGGAATSAGARKAAPPAGTRPSTAAGRTPAGGRTSTAGRTSASAAGGRTPSSGRTPGARGSTTGGRTNSAGRTTTAGRGTAGRSRTAGAARGSRPKPATAGATTRATPVGGTGFYGSSGATTGSTSTHLTSSTSASASNPYATGPAPASSSDWFSTPQQQQPQAMNPYASGASGTGSNPYATSQQQPSSQMNQWQTPQPMQSQQQQPSQMNQWQQPQQQQSATTNLGSNFFSGSMTQNASNGSLTDTRSFMTANTSPGDDYDMENEPPLLEELGINIDHIWAKTKAVILPFKKLSGNAIHMDPAMIVEDADLAGPLMFGLALGGELMVTGKLHFGYIYGFGLFGCLSMTLVLNLMTPKEAISVWTVASILGYSLLPVNILAAVKIVVVNLIKLETFGRILALMAVLWCTVAATRLLEVGCGMRDQRYLIAYPIALLYSAFVLLTIF